MSIIMIILMLVVAFYLMTNKNRRKYKAWERSRKGTWNTPMRMNYR